MKKKGFLKTLAVVTAVVLAFIILPNISEKIASAMSEVPVLGEIVRVVTFREYRYKDEMHTADIEIPQVQVPSVEKENSKNAIKESSAEVNQEIKKIAQKKRKELKKQMEKEGYQEIKVDSEVIVQNERFCTLKLTSFERAGDGYEENYFYTFNLKTGKRLFLSDIFKEDSDYIERISENIKKQMKEQMDGEEDVSYWLEEEDVPENNFQSIAPDTKFYIGENGEVVICFDEGEVAPMYMGTVEFVIPEEIIGDIRKNF